MANETDGTASPSTLLLVIAFASAQQAQKPTDGVAWGSTVSGFRIGAAFGFDLSKPTIRVVFQNVGSVVQDVLLGFDGGGGLMYNMKFIATAQDGKEREGSHISSAVGGFVGPLSVRLNAGESDELQFPLKDIGYGPPTIVRLDALVKQGYSVRVRFEVKQGSADWAKLPRCFGPPSLFGIGQAFCPLPTFTTHWDPWIGTVSSAEVSLAASNISVLLFMASLQRQWVSGPQKTELFSDNGCETLACYRK